MSQTKYLGDAVRSDLVDDKMAGLADPVFGRHHAPRQPEVEHAQTFDLRHMTGTGTAWGFADGIHRGDYQPMIAVSGL